MYPPPVYNYSPLARYYAYATTYLLYPRAPASTPYLHAPTAKVPPTLSGPDRHATVASSQPGRTERPARTSYAVARTTPEPGTTPVPAEEHERGVDHAQTCACTCVAQP